VVNEEKGQLRVCAYCLQKVGGEKREEERGGRRTVAVEDVEGVDDHGGQSGGW
jgi:hypothetical protein